MSKIIISFHACSVTLNAWDTFTRPPPFHLSLAVPIYHPFSFSLYLSLSVTGNMRFFFGPTTPMPRYESRDSRGKRARRCYRYVCASIGARAPRQVCVRAHAHTASRLRVCGRARACVCTRRCARERFTPDYVLRESCERPWKRDETIAKRARGGARATPKIAWTGARIYRAALTALGRAESIYFVGTVCAANTVG